MLRTAQNVQDWLASFATTDPAVMRLYMLSSVISVGRSKLLLSSVLHGEIISFLKPYACRPCKAKMEDPTHFCMGSTNNKACLACAAKGLDSGACFGPTVSSCACFLVLRSWF